MQFQRENILSIHCEVITIDWLQPQANYLILQSRNHTKKNQREKWSVF